MSDGLPTGWCKATLQDIGKWRSGGTPSRQKSEYFGAGIPWVKSGDLKDGPIDRTEEQITEFGSQNSSAKVLPVGTVSMALYGATIGKLGIMTFPAATNQACANVVPNSSLVETLYLYFYLLSQRQVFIESGQGGAQPNISQEIVRAHPIPIAPVNEQERIVAKLKVAIEKVEQCNERLKRIPTILKRFRQSVLAAACSGHLTADWREMYPAGDKNGSTRVGFENEFPETWRTTNLGTLASLITSGSRGWAKYYADTGSTFIRAQNINSDVLNLDDVAFVQLPNRAEGVRTKVHRNDILVTITGANVTKAALVDIDLEDAYISQHVALVRFYEPSSAAFLFLWTVSPSHGRRQLQNAAYGQGKPGLNLDNIRDVDVMMPPVDEQIEIVRRVNSLFTLADQLEARYKKGKAYVDKLTQSILAKAFRGELVPQDPNDEPAEKLLERIREGGKTNKKSSDARRTLSVS